MSSQLRQSVNPGDIRKYYAVTECGTEKKQNQTNPKQKCKQVKYESTEYANTNTHAIPEKYKDNDNSKKANYERKHITK